MNYQQGIDRNQIFFTSFDEQVEQDSFARIVDLLVDALPIEELGFTHNTLNKEGNQPYHPSDMLKLLLYGYRHGLRSSYKLHSACKINIEVIWLLKGLTPAPRTINYFRANNTEAIEKAHRHFVRLLKNWELVSAEVISVDGMKIRGMNSKKNNFNDKKIRRHLEYIEDSISDYLQALEQLENKKKLQPREKEEKTRISEKLDELDHRNAFYQDMQEQVKQSDDGQVSTTDPESRAVIFHRNIVEVGYNIQASVDADYNLVVVVFAGGVNDLNEFSTAGKRAQQITGEKKIDMLADKGYHNGVELAKAERSGIRPFVAPKQQYSSSEEGFRKQDFHYGQHTDSYTCPAGEKLTTNGNYYKKKQKSEYRFKRYATSACQQCDLRTTCTKRQQGRLIERPIHQAYIDRNNTRVRRYPGFYRLRQQVVEPVFGIWKRFWHLDHTIVKGKKAVETEFRLAAISYNLCRSIPKAFWLVQLSYDEKFSKIKAKNAGKALVLSRLFNADIRKFCSKLTDKLSRLWYT